MNTSTYIEAIQADLLAAGDTGDDAVAAAATRLGRAVEPSVRLQVQDALAEAALELSDQLPSGRVEVRVAGRDVSFAFVADPSSAAEAPAEEDQSARITLRLPEALKARVEVAAATEGLSLNTWVVRALRKGVEERRPRGLRLRGFAQS